MSTSNNVTGIVDRPTYHLQLISNAPFNLFSTKLTDVCLPRSLAMQMIAAVILAFAAVCVNSAPTESAPTEPPPLFVGAPPFVGDGELLLSQTNRTLSNIILCYLIFNFTLTNFLSRVVSFELNQRCCVTAWTSNAQ